MPHAQPHLVKHACSIPATCMLLSNCRGPHSIIVIQIRLLDMTGSFWDPHLAVVAELLLLKLAMTLKLELREGIRQDVSYLPACWLGLSIDIYGIDLRQQSKMHQCDDALMPPTSNLQTFWDKMPAIAEKPATS